jgi:hypothetical protein
MLRDTTVCVKRRTTKPSNQPPWLVAGFVALFFLLMVCVCPLRCGAVVVGGSLSLGGGGGGGGVGRRAQRQKK